MICNSVFLKSFWLNYTYTCRLYNSSSFSFSQRAFTPALPLSDADPNRSEHKCSAWMVWLKTALFSQHHRKLSLCLSFKDDTAAQKLEKQRLWVKRLLVWSLRLNWKMWLWGMWNTIFYKWGSTDCFTCYVYSDEA